MSLIGVVFVIWTVYAASRLLRIYPLLKASGVVNRAGRHLLDSSPVGCPEFWPRHDAVGILHARCLALFDAIDEMWPWPFRSIFRRWP